MKLLTLASRLLVGFLLSLLVAGIAWYLWLQEEYMKALDEYTQ